MNLRPSEPHSIRGWQTACKHPGNNGDLREPLTRPLPGNHRPGQGLSTLASTQAGRLEAPALPASSPANRGNGLLAAAPSHRTANWASDTSRRLPGAATAASPRRSAPEAILEQCLDSGRAGTEHGGKEGPQPGVEVQFTARQCVPTALDGSQVIEGRPRSKTPPESSRWRLLRLPTCISLLFWAIEEGEISGNGAHTTPTLRYAGQEQPRNQAAALRGLITMKAGRRVGRP